ncbi:bifunctional folylpolyglutamate synthase/dihydrofolate synthase [Gemmatimonadota bacterium]
MSPRPSPDPTPPDLSPASWTPRQAREWLEGIEFRGMQLGLDRVREFAHRLGNPERSFPSILIAGTNGKGTVAAIIDSILSRAGITTGRYTSPHLIDWPERITVDGREISEGDLAAALQAISSEADALEATPFEAFTMAAMWHFRQKRVEWGIVEVGLGGRLDATRLCDARVTVITAVGHDHVRELGADLAVIAREKGAIMRRGVPAVVGPGTGPVEDILEEEAAAVEAPLVRAVERVVLDTDPTVGWQQSGRALMPGAARGFEWTLPLVGEHMIENLITALAVISLLGEQGLVIPESSVIEGIGKVHWPGRLQYVGGVSGGPDLVLDVGHNPLAARTVVRELLERSGGRPIHLVVAMAEEKDLAQFLDPLVDICSRFVATSWPGQKARSPLEIETTFRSIAEEKGMKIPTAATEGPVAAVREAARGFRERGIIVAIGSHMLVGPLLAVLARGGMEELLPVG